MLSYPVEFTSLLLYNNSRVFRTLTSSCVGEEMNATATFVLFCADVKSGTGDQQLG